MAFWTILWLAFHLFKPLYVVTNEMYNYWRE